MKVINKEPPSVTLRHTDTDTDRIEFGLKQMQFTIVLYVRWLH